MARSKTDSRQSNVELLRILAMLGVVVLHYNSIGGGFKNVPAGGASMWLLYGLEGLFICAVNLFVLITGFFSCTQTRNRPGKALELLLQVAVFQLLAYGIDLYQGAAFSLRTLVMKLVPNNYFVSLYVAVFLLSPYINLLLEKLSRKGLIRLLVVCVALFSVFPTVTEAADALLREDFPGLSPISLDGSISGYSVVNFMLMYLIGASLRLLDIRVKKRWTVLTFGAVVLILTLWGYYDNTTGMARAYCNPLVIAEAVAVFLLFRELKFHSRLVNVLAPASFTCFLLHSSLLEFFRIPTAVRQPVLQVLAHVLFTAITIYLVSWPAHMVYGAITNRPVRVLLKWLRIDREYSLENQQEE